MTYAPLIPYAFSDKRPVSGLGQDTRARIRDAVALAVRYWPNAHLGSFTTREDIRSAFFMIREGHKAGNIHNAICRLESDAYAHSDM